MAPDPLAELLRPDRSWTARWGRLRSTVVSTTGSGRGWMWVAAVAALVAVGVVVGVHRSATGGRATPPVEMSLPRADHGGEGGGPVGSVAPGASAAPSVASGASGAAPGPPTTGAATLVVDVSGAVVQPGLVHLPAGARVADAVAAAGGARADAELERLNQAQPLADGTQVYVPVRGQPAPEPVAAGSAVDGPGRGGSPSGVRVAGSRPGPPVDLNAASASDLDALPGVGPSTAAAILDYRRVHGRFRSVDELGEVRGIGDTRLANLRPLVRVGPS